ncbi:MAG: hypothetical protein JNL39_06305 [Opitutaceae bacterium]|nr:hypothetical protein [Opitutaceae bacterium]
MRIVFKLVAFLLLALWLPATEHCALESAGFTILAHDDHHSESCKDTCQDDACHSIEGVSYPKASSDLRVLPPTVSFACCLLSVLVAPAVVPREPVSLATAPPELQALGRTWQFVRRAALPARAPDCAA